MIVTIDNFRCYDHAEYTLPDKGLVLISADSGKGKTTLLLTLLYAFYGCVKKTGGFAKKNGKTKVKIQFSDGTTIERSTRPNKLLFTDLEGSVYEMDEAQSHIDQFLGVTQTEYILSCCLIQGVSGGILSLGSAQILKVIQKVCCGEGEERKESLKKTIKKDLKVIEENLSGLVKEKEVYTKLIQTPPTTIPKPKGYLSIAKLKNKLGECVIQREKYEKELESVVKKLEEQKILLAQKNTINKVLEGHVLEIEKLRDTIESQKGVKEKLSKKQEKLEQVNNMVQKLERIKSLENKFLEIENNKRSYEKLVEKRGETEKILDHLKKTKVLREEVKLRNQTVDKKLKDLKSKIQDLGYNIEDHSLDKKQNFYLRCPSDKCGVCIKIGKNGTPKISSDETSKESVVVNYHTFSKARGLYKEYKSLKIEKEPDFSESAFVKLVAEYKKLVNIFPPSIAEEEEKELKNLKERTKDVHLDILTKKSKKLKTKLAFLKKEKDVQRKNKNKRRNLSEDISSLKAKIEKIKVDDIDPMEEKREELKNSIETTKKKETELQNLREECGAYEKYLSLQADHYKKIQEISRLSTCIVRTKKEHSTLTFIKECLIKAELISTEEIISYINERVKIYLSEFFNEDIPSIQLVLGKEVGKGKKKKVKHVLSVDVTMKGYVYDGIKSLSKGERKRVKLAFVLSLSDILRRGDIECIAPMPSVYLMDECLSNLDTDKQTEILGLLKERDGLYLIVSHDAIKGIFDETISW